MINGGEADGRWQCVNTTDDAVNRQCAHDGVAAPGVGASFGVVAVVMIMPWAVANVLVMPACVTVRD